MKLVTLPLVVLLALVSWASGQTTSGQWTYMDSGTTITASTANGAVTIPSVLGGRTIPAHMIRAMSDIVLMFAAVLMMVVGALSGYIIARWKNLDAKLGAACGAVIGFALWGARVLWIVVADAARGVHAPCGGVF